MYLYPTHKLFKLVSQNLQIVLGDSMIHHDSEITIDIAIVAKMTITIIMVFANYYLWLYGGVLEAIICTNTEVNTSNKSNLRSTY